MKTFLATFLLLLIVTSAVGQKTLDDVLKLYNTRSIPYISVGELKRLQSQGELILLDTRELEEFDTSHIPLAVYAGYSSFSSEEITATIEDKNTPIVVYCSLGIRSEIIGEKLKKAGFTNVQNLYGGIIEWKNKDYVVVDSLGNTTENVHTSSKSWSKWLEKGKKVYD
jgi:rhodanese-related sulfurtransferase